MIDRFQGTLVFVGSLCILFGVIFESPRWYLIVLGIQYIHCASIGPRAIWLFQENRNDLSFVLNLGLVYFLSILDFVLLGFGNWSPATGLVLVLLLLNGLTLIAIFIWALVCWIKGPPTYKRAPDCSNVDEEFKIDYLASQYCIGICSAPGRSYQSKVNLSKDVDVIVEENTGLEVLCLNLMTEDEINLMGFSKLEYFKVFTDRGVEVRHFPMRDKWVTPTFEELNELTCQLALDVRYERAIIIHCFGGKGRAATIAAALVMKLERETTSHVVTQVKSTRNGSLRNLLQLYYLWCFNAYLDNPAGYESRYSIIQMLMASKSKLLSMSSLR